MLILSNPENIDKIRVLFYILKSQIKCWVYITMADFRALIFQAAKPGSIPSSTYDSQKSTMNNY